MTLAETGRLRFTGADKSDIAADRVQSIRFAGAHRGRSVRESCMRSI